MNALKVLSDTNNYESLLLCETHREVKVKEYTERPSPLRRGAFLVFAEFIVDKLYCSNKRSKQG